MKQIKRRMERGPSFVRTRTNAIAIVVNEKKRNIKYKKDLWKFTNSYCLYFRFDLAEEEEKEKRKKKWNDFFDNPISPTTIVDSSPSHGKRTWPMSDGCFDFSYPFSYFTFQYSRQVDWLFRETSRRHTHFCTAKSLCTNRMTPFFIRTLPTYLYLPTYLPT